MTGDSNVALLLGLFFWFDWLFGEKTFSILPNSRSISSEFLLLTNNLVVLNFLSELCFVFIASSLNLKLVFPKLAYSLSFSLSILLLLLIFNFSFIFEICFVIKSNFFLDSSLVSLTTLKISFSISKLLIFLKLS